MSNMFGRLSDGFYYIYVSMYMYLSGDIGRLACEVECVCNICVHIPCNSFSLSAAHYPGQWACGVFVGPIVLYI